MREGLRRAGGVESRWSGGLVKWGGWWSRGQVEWNAGEVEDCWSRRLVEWRAGAVENWWREMGALIGRRAGATEVR